MSARPLWVACHKQPELESRVWIKVQRKREPRGVVGAGLEMGIQRKVRAARGLVLRGCLWCGSEVRSQSKPEMESKIQMWAQVRVERKGEPGGVVGVVLEMAENKMFHMNEGD